MTHRMPPRGDSLPVVVDYLLSHLGFFGALAVLPLVIQHLHPTAGAAFVGGALLFFTFAVRGGSLFCSQLLHAATIRLAMSGGLLLAGAGFALLSVTPGQLGAIGCLALAGLGISINGLAARAYVTMIRESPSGRNAIFSAIQIAANISAAVGPAIANFLVSDRRHLLTLLLVAMMYAAAAAFVAVAIPAGLRPRDMDVREPIRLGLLSAIVADPKVRRVSLVAMTGSFLYGQFFSAFVIQVAHVTSSPTIRAGFFTINAILVIALQIPVTKLTKAGLDRNVPPLRYLLIGVAVFSASCAIFGIIGSLVAGIFIGVAVFALAEVFFTPMVNTAYADIAGDRPIVEAFSFRQIAVSVGEALGAFSGGALFLPALSHGVGHLYWIILAVVGLGIAGAFLGFARVRETDLVEAS